MSSLQELLKKKRQDIAAKSGQREKAAKIPDGKSIMRVLPTWRKDGSEQFWHDYGMHWIKDDKGELKATYVCVDKTFNRPCDVCEAINRAYDHASDDLQIKALDQSKSRNRILINVLFRAGAGVDATKPVFVEVSPTMFGQIIDIAEEYGDIIDPNDGLDLIVNKTGRGMDTKYTIQPCPPKKNQPVVDQAILDQMIDLDEWVNQEYEAGQIKALNAINSTVGLISADKPVGALSHDGKGEFGADDDDDDMSDILDADYEEVEVKAEKVSDKPASSAPVNQSVDDDELDDLLGDLEAL